MSTHGELINYHSAVVETLLSLYGGFVNRTRAWRTLEHHPITQTLVAFRD